eukprot:COSAG05_NODE_3738_length_1870_cov_1.447205_2_plen_408_part_00
MEYGSVERGQALVEAAKAGEVGRVTSLLNDHRGGSHPLPIDAREGEHVDGLTALHYATASGSLELAQLLVEAGCDVNLADGSGDTALLSACNLGHVEVASILLANGAAIDLQNSGSSESPLIVAVRNENVELVELLLSTGAATDLVAKDGHTALGAAAVSNNPGVGGILVANGATLDDTEKNEQLEGFVSHVEQNIAAAERARANRTVAQRWQSWEGSGITLVVKLVDVQQRNTRLLSFLRSDKIGGKLWSEAAFDAFDAAGASGVVISMDCEAETTIPEIRERLAEAVGVSVEEIEATCWGGADVGSDAPSLELNTEEAEEKAEEEETQEKSPIRTLGEFPVLMDAKPARFVLAVERASLDEFVSPPAPEPEPEPEPEPGVEDELEAEPASEPEAEARAAGAARLE